MREKLRTATYYLPAVLWVVVIFSFSTGSFSYQHTEGWIERLLTALWPAALSHLNETCLAWLNVGVRKLAHLTEYAVLAVFLHRAYVLGHGGRGPHRFVPAFLLATACAIADEYRQSFYAARTAAPTDVLLDSLGAALGLAAVWFYERRHAKCPTSVSRR